MRRRLRDGSCCIEIPIADRYIHDELVCGGLNSEFARQNSDEAEGGCNDNDVIGKTYVVSRLPFKTAHQRILRGLRCLSVTI